MKTWTKTVLAISLSLMCLFMCIGYAVVSGNLSVLGNASFAPPPEPEGLYISKVETILGQGVYDVENQIILPTSLKATANPTGQNTSITYAITVTNKTEMTYWYLGVEFEENGATSNSLIGKNGGVAISTKDTNASNSASFDTNDWIPPLGERTFYATYTFGANAQGNITTLVNFSFGLHMGSVADEFLRVLNDKNSDYGYYYLADAFNNQYAENKSTVIGNLGDEAEVFNNLFGSNLTVNMDGQDLPVTILVERTNVDGKNTGDSYPGSNSPSGCEYTIYITVDDLENVGQATVYAVSYTCGADGVWYKIGELYEGTSSVEVYENSNDPDDIAFDVDSWLAVKKSYTVINGVSYTVGAGTNEGQPFDRCKTIEELMSITGDTEFYNKVNNGSANLLKPVCTIIYSYQHVNGKWVESINQANCNKEGYAQLKAAFDRLKPNCFINNGGFERLENASTFSRAELVSMLEDIQIAYDYYKAVNP